MLVESLEVSSKEAQKNEVAMLPEARVCMLIGWLVDGV